LEEAAVRERMKNGVPGSRHLRPGIFLPSPRGRRKEEATMASCEKDIVQEVFVIKTDRIEFLGKMVRKGCGGWEVNGEVLFRDGTHWSFASPEGEQERLRDMMIRLCDRMAAFYGTKMLRVKFHDGIEAKEFSERLRASKQNALHP
jgi:hypothetical protein